jgi:hypothetical protein
MSLMTLRQVNPPMNPLLFSFWSNILTDYNRYAQFIIEIFTTMLVLFPISESTLAGHQIQ